MDKQIFVQNVKKYCKLKGVKPTVACRESGVGSSFINNIESRNQTPSVEKVQQLADYLGVTTSELLGENKNYQIVEITHQFPFQNSLEDLYASLEDVGPLLALSLRDHIEGSKYLETISTPLSVWLYAQVRSLEPIELEENPEGMSHPHTPYNFIDDNEREMLRFYRLSDKEGRELMVKALCASIEQRPGEDKPTIPFEGAPVGFGQLNHIYRTLNNEGQEKLLEYAIDLEASGRYIKSDQTRVGEEKNA